MDLEKDLEPVELVLDQAIPCGLILNELISNALKHAFPDGAQGRIHIGLRAVDDRVEITDRRRWPGPAAGLRSGRGMPTSVCSSWKRSSGNLMDTSSVGRPVRDRGVGYFLTFGRTGFNKNA